MRRLYFWFAASALAAPAGAATVLERSIRVQLRPGGIRESHALRVQLDRVSDLARYSPYPIALDLNRRASNIQAAIQRAGGTTVRLDQKSFDTVASPSGGELHSSRRYQTVSFAGAAPGDVLSLSYDIETDPYFTSEHYHLVGRDAVTSLSVVVEGSPGIRYHLLGPARSLAVSATDTRLALTGRDVAGIEAPDWSETSAGALTLLVAWGPRRSWLDVGEWYLELIRALPRASEELRPVTASIRGATPRETLAAALAWTREKVRYVAVEVGVGGYVPHAPDVTRRRGWGDCKDKAILLVDLLRSAGLDSFPALVLSDRAGRVAPSFPSPFHFNHMVVAVPAVALGGEPGVPGLLHAGGFVFVDPTQDRGGLEYTHSGIVDQLALVVRPGASELVKTPVRGFSEEKVEATWSMGPSGGIEGTLIRSFDGDMGYSMSARAAAQVPSDDVTAATRALRDLSSGLTLSGVELRPDGERSDRVLIHARVTGSSGRSTNPTLRLPWVPAIPSASILESRDGSVVLQPGVRDATWTITLPSGWCAPALAPIQVGNEVGAFDQRLEKTPGGFVVRRRSEIKVRLVDPPLFEALRTLSLAEHRAAARTLRLDCPS